MTVLVVTGTDTGVGKTIVTAALAAAARAAGRTVTVVKPTQTGDDDDAAVIARLSGVTDIHTFARLDAPLAPASAGSSLTAVEVVERIRALPAVDGGLILVEGAGGLLVRMGPDDATIADVARLLGAPALVVVRAGLGTLNHTALTVEALEARGVVCPGILIGSWPAEPGLAERTNLEDLPRYASRPLLGRVPEGAGRLEPDAFAARASTWIEGKLV